MKLSYSILPSSRTSLTFAIRGGIELHETPRTQLQAIHPNVYTRYSAKHEGFFVYISDYVGGFGRTLDEAYADALEVATLDLLTHDKLTEVL